MQTWRALVAARRRPVVDYAVGMAFVAVAVFFIVWPLTETESPTPAPTQVSSQMQLPVTAPYSESDVERARTKAKWTFGYITRISQQPAASQPFGASPSDRSPSTAADSLSADPVPDVIPAPPDQTPIPPSNR